MADLLQMVHVLKSRNGIRIVRALSAVGAVWFCGAGMFHLVHNLRIVTIIMTKIPFKEFYD